MLLNPDLEIAADDINRFFEISKKIDFALTGPSIIQTEKVYTEDSWILGHSMLFNMAKMQETGFFDPNIFLYGEENDLCYRVIKSGEKICYVHNIPFVHLEKKSSPTNDAYVFLRKYHQTYGSFYLKRKHNGIIKSFRLAFAGIFKGMLQYCLSRPMKKNPIEQKARIIACIAFLIGKSPFDKDGNGLYTVKS